MRLLVLVQKHTGIAPNQRFRHEQWAPHLARNHDITLEFEPFESPALTEVLYQPGHLARKAALVLRDATRRWLRRDRGRAFDGVVVLREAMPVGGPIIERSIVHAGVPLIFDFDDAIWHEESTRHAGLAALARAPGKTSRICEMATAVTVGNEYLAAYARQFNPEVHIVRTSIELERFRELPMPPADDPFTIVWTGSHSTIVYLDTVREAIERVAARRPVRLRVMCDRPPAPYTNATLDFVPWRPDREAIDLGPGHVGIMPVPDTEFARGKCGCKALQYMAVGRPALVSPVGINTEIVQDGVNGLLASSQDEWVAQLERLANSAALRVRLAGAGRQTVLKEFTAESSAAAFAEVARRAVAARRPR